MVYTITNPAGAAGTMPQVSPQVNIEPDTKDWTWVLDRPCPECGYDGAQVDPRRLVDLLHENTRGWFGVLDRDHPAVRPVPDRWSRLEYACHVRDVHEVFAGRVRLMLEQEAPTFTNWDQDATALEKRYDEQDLAVVAVELVERAAAAAAAYAGVGEDQWQRTGLRSNGSQFTIETLGRYHLHDVVHHLWDVGVTPHLPESTE
jgi:hypothetical protein